MKNKEEVLNQLLDEVYEKFPNESYSDFDIAEHVYDNFQPKQIKINSESDLPNKTGEYWFVWNDNHNSITRKMIVMPLDKFESESICKNFNKYTPVVAPTA